MKKVSLKKIVARRGLALVAVLWVVVLLTVIVAALAHEARLETRITMSRAEQTRGRWAVRAGLEQAAAILQEDPVASDSLDGIWADEELTAAKLDGCTVQVRIEDEAGKLNVNTATREQLMELEFMTAEIADAIIDWRDSDETPGPAGAEAGYYLNLAYGYESRNAPFRTIRELLLVKDVTEKVLYGEDTNQNGELDYNENDGEQTPPMDNRNGVLDTGWIAYLTCYSYSDNTDAEGNRRVNINSANEQQLTRSLGLAPAQARWIVQNRGNNGFESIADIISENNRQPQARGNDEESDRTEPLDMQTFAGIADRITVNDSRQIEGPVNINTAPREVLAALLQGDRQVAEDIAAYRQSRAGGFKSIAEVMNVESVGLERFREIVDNITTRSNVYTVQCRARSEKTGAVYNSETVIDRGPSPATILYHYEGTSS